MIPARLSDITWQDIESLISTERVEDDMLEFKSSFKGSTDFDDLAEGQRKKAIDSLARELIAFLNGRGGDLIVGIEESSDGTGRAEKIALIENVALTTERLLRSLNAIIEPRQSDLYAKPVTNPDDEERGVILLRAGPSLRAPHRSARDRECYLRRGSESVPMTMEEIHNLTLNRSLLRREKLEQLDQQFGDFEIGKSDHHAVGSPIVHIRMVVIPASEQTLPVDEKLTSMLSRTGAEMFRRDGTRYVNDVAFRNLYNRWRPILRGMKLEPSDIEEALNDSAKLYASKKVKETGIASWEIASAVVMKDGEPHSIHYDWIQGFFAVAFSDINLLIQSHEHLAPLILRIGVRFSGNLALKFGESFYGSSYPCPEGISYFPDQEIDEVGAVETLFEQAQRDFSSLIGLRNDDPYSLSAPL